MQTTTTRGSEQLLLSFDDMASGPVYDPFKERPRQVHPTLPEWLTDIKSNELTLEALLTRLGFEGIKLKHSWHGEHGRVAGNRAVEEITTQPSKDICFKRVTSDRNGATTYGTTLAYFDTAGNLWSSELDMCFDTYLFPYNSKTAYCNGYTIGTWKMQKAPRLTRELTLLQDNDELAAILESTHPYAAEWAKKNSADAVCLLMAPQIEILAKAGYGFALDFTKFIRLQDKECELFGRLCVRGTKPQNIFKTSKAVYSVLKDCKDMETWDCYRRMFKTGKINADIVQEAYARRYSAKELESISSILAKRHNGKAVFTWNSLMQYLTRLDTFEAIAPNEAFMLLNDYLSMCSQLNMEPRIDGDSLKREHDIAARNIRNRRDEILAEKMKDACEKMSRYDYSENIYFVRAIRGHEDLLDEARQQHNCVASYGYRIADGSSYIYVMREVSHPDRSLITIELTPSNKSIRQKFLAYNQPIHNRSQSEFLDRWLKHIRTIG